MAVFPLRSNFRDAARWAALFAASSLAVATAQAALTWETTRVDAEARIDQDRLSTRFAFQNTGGTAITITELQTSCGCTTAELTKKTYAPGESGAIQVVFTFGDRSGPQQKVVTVKTDDAPGEPVALIVRVNIPVALTFERTLLSWTPGEPLKPQSVGVAINPAAQLKILGVRSNLPSIKATLVADAKGNGYHIIVTPDADTKSGSAAILVDTERAGQAKTYTIYALIR